MSERATSVADQILDRLQRLYQRETPPPVEDLVELGKLLRAFGTGKIITDTETHSAAVSHFRGAILASLTQPNHVADFLRKMQRGVYWQQARGWLAKFARKVQAEIAARTWMAGPQSQSPAPVASESRADTSADTTQKKFGYVPRNNDVLKLAHKLKKDGGNGRSENDIALEFTEGNAKRAKSLLRSVRRWRENI